MATDPFPTPNSAQHLSYSKNKAVSYYSFDFQLPPIKDVDHLFIFVLASLLAYLFIWVFSLAPSMQRARITEMYHHSCLRKQIHNTLQK